MGNHYEEEHWKAMNSKQRVRFARLAILPRAIGALLERGTLTDHGPPSLLRGDISMSRCSELVGRLMAFCEASQIREFLMNQNEPDDLLIVDFAMRWVQARMPDEEPDTPSELASVVRWTVLLYGCSLESDS